MTIRRRTFGIAGLAVMACALTACSTGPAAEELPKGASTVVVAPASPSATPSEQPYGGLPALDRLDHTDATAVSRAAVTIMWTVDARIDQGQRDAYLRAAPLLTAQYAASLHAEPAGKNPPEWSDHEAYASVRVAQEQPKGDVAPDTATTAHRYWQIIVTPTGRDGWEGQPVRASAFVTLVRQDDRSPWKVSAVGTA